MGTPLRSYSPTFCRELWTWLEEQAEGRKYDNTGRRVRWIMRIGLSIRADCSELITVHINGDELRECRSIALTRRGSHESMPSGHTAGRSTWSTPTTATATEPATATWSGNTGGGVHGSELKDKMTRSIRSATPRTLYNPIIPVILTSSY